MDKQIKIVFTGPAKAIFDYIEQRAEHSKAEKSMYAAIKRKLELIRINPHYGNIIPKRLIPKEYIKSYHAYSLYRVELPQFWRMLYTINGGQIEILAIVLDILDHKQYNKKFNYK